MRGAPRAVLAYVPVLHEAYYEFFRHSRSNTLFIFGEDLIQKFDPLRKDIRALEPYLIRQAIESWGIFGEVRIADDLALRFLNQNRWSLVMPDEDVCRDVASQYLKDCQVEFVRIFLRWDRQRTLVQNEAPYDEVITADEFTAKVMRFAQKETEKSSDWWRQVAAVAVRDGEVLISAFNRHVPSPNFVFSFGDPRANFKKGVHFELSPALHAEAAIVAEAARKGLCLEGADLYVTTFPCPPCAKLVAYSGFKRLFFLEGYSVYDGGDVLKACGVKILLVKFKPPR